MVWTYKKYSKKFILPVTRLLVLLVANKVVVTKAGDVVSWFDDVGMLLVLDELLVCKVVTTTVVVPIK